LYIVEGTPIVPLDQAGGVSLEQESLSATWRELITSLAAAATFEVHQEWIPRLLGAFAGHKTTTDREPLDVVRGLVEEHEFEAGESHPAQAELEAALRARPDSAARFLEDLWAVLASDEKATLLRCLGQLAAQLVELPSSSLISDALASDRLPVRHAAARALEAWGTSRSRGILTKHQQNEPSQRLKNYIGRAVRDLA
jgi:hypothetical protein